MGYNKKTYGRVSQYLGFVVRYLIVPSGNFVAAYLAIREGSQALWGSFVEVLISVSLASYIFVWGNKEFLLREFSLAPARIKQLWTGTIVARLSLMLVLLPLPFLLFSWQDALWIDVLDAWIFYLSISR